MQRVEVIFHPMSGSKRYTYTWHGERTLSIGDWVSVPVTDYEYNKTACVVALANSYRGECAEVIARATRPDTWQTLITSHDAPSASSHATHTVEEWSDRTITCTCRGWEYSPGGYDLKECRHTVPYQRDSRNSRSLWNRPQAMGPNETVAPVKRRRTVTPADRKAAQTRPRAGHTTEPVAPPTDEFSAHLLRAVADAAAEREAKLRAKIAADRPAPLTDAERRTIQPTDKSKPGPRKRSPLPMPMPERVAEVPRHTFRPVRPDYPYNEVPREERPRKPAPRKPHQGRPNREDYGWSKGE